MQIRLLFCVHESGHKKTTYIERYTGNIVYILTQVNVSNALARFFEIECNNTYKLQWLANFRLHFYALTR